MNQTRNHASIAARLLGHPAFLLSLAALLAMSTYAAMACAGVSLGEIIQHTFAPMTWAEFLFPPCPICWLARGTAVATIVFVARVVA